MKEWMTIREKFSYPDDDPYGVQNIDKVIFPEVRKKLLSSHEERRPTELCHYTSAYGLEGILRSGEIWATHIAHSNDAKEYQHFVDFILEIMERDISIAELVGKKGSTKVTFIETWANVAKVTKLVFDRVGPSVDPVWIACFSRDDKNDDLSQWRAYGMGEGGYCLCLDRSEVENIIARDNNVLLLPCIYDEEAIRTQLANAMSEVVRITAPTFDLVEHEADQFKYKVAYAIARGVHFIAPIVKHPSFRSEDEWRIVKYTEVNDPIEYEIRPKPTMMSPYIPINLKTEEGRLPITKIVVGPGRYKERSGVEWLLTKHGYKIKKHRGEKGDGLVSVELSKSPYRVG